MKILVVGCGSIGKRHIRNLLSVNAGEIIACDINDKKLNDVKEEFSIKAFSNVEEALNINKYGAAFICTPPSYHVVQALKFLELGMHCFIEKPLSNSLEGIDDLINMANSKQKTVTVGYNIRFSPLLKKIKKLIDKDVIGNILSLRASSGYYLPYWRPNEDYRKGYGSKEEEGGGIVFDASHEIDYVRYLVGEIDEVFAVCKKLSSLEIDTEDFAEITMHHRNGAYSQIHLDYLQTNYRRSCEIIGESGMLVWDINERVLKQYGQNDKEYHAYYEGLNANVNDMYLEEVRHFFRCMNGYEEPLININEGKRIQEIIIKIKESSDKKRVLQV
ncbi:MAG: Gfo/Idh/MocA family oxidoreductase [Thermodesulfobacteriota bacterium]